MPAPFPPSEKPSQVIHLEEPILGYRTIEIGFHAVERMEQRGVSLEDVLKTLRNGRQVPGKQPRGRIRVKWNKTARLRIDVIFEKLKDRLGVVTVIPFGGGLSRR